MDRLKPHTKIYLQADTDGKTNWRITTWGQDRINDDVIVYVRAGNKQKEIDRLTAENEKQTNMLAWFGVYFQQLLDDIKRAGKQPSQAMQDKLNEYKEWIKDKQEAK